MTQWSWLGDKAATAQRRQDLWRLLGPRPSLSGAPSGTLLATSETAVARIEHWTLTLNAVEPVPALLLLPKEQPPRGIVIYCHAHGNRFECGKDELLHGRPAIASQPYAEVLPLLGYAVLAIDHWCFGERAGNTEHAMVKRLLWEGRTLWGYRVHDTLVALDWLRSREGFAALPTVTLGLSMGSTMAVWAAALEPSIDACIDLCCLAEYDALVADGSFDLHGEYFFIPSLRREFSAGEISALIAPRRHLSLIGQHDPLTPPNGVAAIDRAMQSTYSKLQHAKHWTQITDDCGHQETALMRKHILATLQNIVTR
ncbi:MAG: alpha/beta hydrolase [Casimicrobium sp.]